MHGSAFVSDLALVLCVAAATAVLARLLRQSNVLAYLLAGLIVGPNLLVPVFADPARVGALAEFGVVLVMFAVGLELRVSKLVRVLPTSGLTGLVQVAFLAWCGISLGSLLGWGRVESVFLGASIAISSTMVVTRVFEEVRVPPDARAHVVGVLVVQDVLAIALITALTVVAAGGGLSTGALLGTLGKLVGVLCALLVGGLLLVPRLVRAVARLGSQEILLLAAVGLCFGMAKLAERLGYSVALGAFLSGTLVAESGRGRSIETLVAPLRDVFAAVFFVSIGMSVDPALALASLPTALAVVVVVVVAQLVIVSLAGVLSGLGLRRSMTAGLALGQIGEFSFILGAIGVGAGVVRPALQPILVTVSVLTAFTTPLLLRRAEAVVHFVDRRLPQRVQHVLTLYESWLERYRAVGVDSPEGAGAARALRAIVVDALGLLALLAAVAASLPRLAGLVAGALHVARPLAWTLVSALALVLVSPVLLALVRNTARFARQIGDGVVSRYARPSPGVRLAGTSASLMVVLGVLLAVGLPSVAVLRPLLDAPLGMALLLAIAGVVSLRLWKQAGAIGAEYRTGAGELAGLIARQGAGGGAEPGAETELLPGLESARSTPVRPGSAAEGRTLAEINLRARTGATVVAILRRGGNVLLPTGRERLEVGDTLALVGSGAALLRAQAALEERARAPEDGAGIG